MRTLRRRLAAWLTARREPDYASVLQARLAGERRGPAHLLEHPDRRRPRHVAP